MCSINIAITFEIPTIQLSKVKSKKVEITDDKLIEEDLTKEELSNSIGKIVRELRLSKKMSLECLSNETGIGYSQLSRIERGKINTSIYQIYLIIKTLNVPINTLLEVLITDVIRSYKQKNKKYIKNKINKSIMKKITLFLLSCVLFTTACNQSNTTPTTPVIPSCNTLNSAFFEISFNGKTLKSNGYEYQGLKGGTLASIYPSAGGESSIIIQSTYFCPMGNLVGNCLISYFDMYKSGTPTTGTYNNNYVSTCSIGDFSSGAGKIYFLKDSTLSANVTSITSDYVTGTFSCTLKDATNEYPATGSFNVLRIN